MTKGTGGYEPNPVYPVARGGRVRRGWREAGRLAPRNGVLAIEGPLIADWDAVLAGLGSYLTVGAVVDMRSSMAPWEQVRERTAPHELLREDPDFATIPAVRLADLFDKLPVLPPSRGVTVVFGPGSALVEHNTLWYADLPKRYAEAAVAGGGGHNLGAPPSEPATTRRLFYVDWPLLDGHRDALAERIEVWLDLQDPENPVMLDGAALRATLTQIARAPFRTRPTFNTTSWGGHWGQRELGFNVDRPNTALGYELIAPESGILLGSDLANAVEVPFQLAVALHPLAILGADVHGRFGASFPIRFDYLDTVDGGSLSVHCHPRADYMRSVFGWPYTQHETYYIMVGSPDNTVFLGLHEDVDIDEFQEQAHTAQHASQPFNIARYVQRHPATQHQLFLIPSGTPHGSGEGNVVLEISATPYLYSLRFYDWLRRDAGGQQRPVHVDHAFRNLDSTRTGARVASELIPQPHTVVTERGWREELIGALPEMFFRIHRLELEAGTTNVRQSTGGRFHILNLVSGSGVVVRTDCGAHPLRFAETLVVPAEVGEYTLSVAGDEPVRLVKAFVA